MLILHLLYEGEGWLSPDLCYASIRVDELPVHRLRKFLAVDDDENGIDDVAFFLLFLRRIIQAHKGFGIVHIVARTTEREAIGGLVDIVAALHREHLAWLGMDIEIEEVVHVITRGREDQKVARLGEWGVE